MPMGLTRYLTLLLSLSTVMILLLPPSVLADVVQAEIRGQTYEENLTVRMMQCLSVISVGPSLRTATVSRVKHLQILLRRLSKIKSRVASFITLISH